MGYFKICSKCGVEKPIQNYRLRKETGNRSSVCNKCRNKQITENRDKTTVTNNKQKFIKNQKSNRRFIKLVKIFSGCTVCGEKYAECLDLHHIDMSNKEFTPSDMIRKQRDVIKTELRKCVVLCANHHRMVHSGRINLQNYLTKKEI